MSGWEAVTANTYRMKVEGGWLYRYDTEGWVVSPSVHEWVVVSSSLVFVPTPRQET